MSDSSDSDSAKPSSTKVQVFIDPMALDFALNSKEKVNKWLDQDQLPLASDDRPSASIRSREGSSPTGRFVRDEQQKSRNKVPCKFHDGVSEKCWKGPECRFGHELFTGGRFAAKHPELSVAAGCRREVTSTINLPSKPVLPRGARICAVITSVVSPSEFYIRVESISVDDPKNRETYSELFGDAPKDRDVQNNCYGICELELDSEAEALKKDSKSATEDLTEYFNCFHGGEPSMKLQQDFYFPDVELVAVKNHAHWMRAVVLPSETDDMGKIRVQLLDTGEKMKVLKENVCQLPGNFCQSHAEAYKCCLFGYSPTGPVWNSEATKMFEKLVYGNRVNLVVKNELHCTTNLFETTPYVVQLSVKSDDPYYASIDVGENLLEAGYSVRWASDPDSVNFNENELL